MLICEFARRQHLQQQQQQQHLHKGGLINELRLNSNFWSGCFGCFGWIGYLILVCVQFWLQLQMQLPQVASSAAAAAAVAVGCELDGRQGQEQAGRGRGFWHTDTERHNSSSSSIESIKAATCCNMRRPSDLDLCCMQRERRPLDPS